jgi:hypothetical protein
MRTCPEETLAPRHLDDSLLRSGRAVPPVRVLAVTPNGSRVVAFANQDRRAAYAILSWKHE